MRHLFSLSILTALLLSSTACSKRESVVAPITAADRAIPVAVETAVMPGTAPVAASESTSFPASASTPTAATGVLVKVPLEDTQEPVSLDAARLPNGAALAVEKRGKK